MKKTIFAVKEIQGHQILHLEDRPVMCAFRTPFITVNTITGGPDLNMPACGSNCQFFEISKDPVILGDFQFKPGSIHIPEFKGEAVKVELHCKGDNPRVLICDKGL
jgi:hypothetical protein